MTISSKCQEPSFVVRIHGSSWNQVGCGETKFLGTGILLTPHYVVTCAHVVAGIGTWESAASRGEFPKDLAVLKSDAPAVSVAAVVYDKGEKDLALLKLERPLPDKTSCATWWENIDPNVLRNMSLEDIRVAGFCDDRFVHSILGKLISADASPTGTLQFQGALSPGMSGSALLLGDSCLGIAYLGGEGSGQSRVHKAGGVLELLKDADPNAFSGVTSVPAVRAPATRSQWRRRALLSLGTVCVFAAIAYLVASRCEHPIDFGFRDRDGHLRDTTSFEGTFAVPVTFRKVLAGRPPSVISMSAMASCLQSRTTRYTSRTTRDLGAQDNTYWVLLPTCTQEEEVVIRISYGCSCNWSGHSQRLMLKRYGAQSRTSDQPSMMNGTGVLADRLTNCLRTFQSTRPTPSAGSKGVVGPSARVLGSALLN